MDTTDRLAELLGQLSRADEVQRALLDLTPAAVADAARFFEARDFATGEVLMEESSDDVDAVLLLVQGEATATVRPSTVEGRPGEPQVVGRLEPLDVVGEIGLVLKTPRTATVRADGPLRALSVRREALAELLQVQPDLANALVRWCAQNAAEKIGRTRRMHQESYPVGLGLREDPAPGASIMLDTEFAEGAAERNYAPAGPKTTELIRKRLQELRCFDWEASSITPGVAELFRLVQVPSRRAIVSEGEPGESVLIMSRGIAKIRQRDGELVHGWVAGHQRPVHTLVGEMTFLNPGPRTGTVLASTACELLELSATELPDLARRAPWVAHHLHLGLLRAVCPKLAETSAYRATIAAVAQGDWEQWFVDDDYYTRRVKALEN